MVRKIYVWVAVVLILVASNCRAMTVSVSVPATSWVDTGITVAAGSTIHVLAQGRWTPAGENNGVNWDGPDGRTGWYWYPPNWNDGFCPTAACASLIGFIGVTPPSPGSYSVLPIEQVEAYRARTIALGSNVTTTAPSSGRLFLGMNDDATSNLTVDNFGSLTAQVEAENIVPEPSSILAMLMGIGGLGGAYRLKRR